MAARKLHGFLIALGAAAALSAGACSDGGSPFRDAATDRAAGDAHADMINARLDVPVERADAGGDASSDKAGDGTGGRPSDAGDASPDVADAGSDMRTALPDGASADVPDQTPDGPTDRPATPPDAPAVDAPSDASSDASSDAPADVVTTSDAADDQTASPDAPPPADADAADASGDDCGAGCPRNVQPQSLLLWLSADVGVTCNPTTARVSSWLDRSPAARVFQPVANIGPQCGGAAHAIAGKAVPFFDRPGSDANDGVLAVDLSSMVGSDYTVFVVERRLSGDEGYVLGTSVPDVSAGTSCGSAPTLNWKAYHFGYAVSGNQTAFTAGAYGYSTSTFDCTDLFVPVAAFSAGSPKVALDVERFDHTLGRAAFIGTTAEAANDDQQAILSLVEPGYLGRAFQTFNPGTGLARGSRFLGEIAEVVIYTAALSDDDRAAVSSYLMTRWQIAP